jgi:hypothetical protein
MIGKPTLILNIGEPLDWPSLRLLFVADRRVQHPDHHQTPAATVPVYVYRHRGALERFRPIAVADLFGVELAGWSTTLRLVGRDTASAVSYYAEGRIAWLINRPLWSLRQLRKRFTCLGLLS